MNQLLSLEQTMDSREIAVLTEKEHKHVLRDIELMLEQLDLKEEGYAQKWTHPQNGQKYPMYRLPKNLTLNLVSGYNAVLRMRIIDRWIDLERTVQPKFHVPTCFSEALRLAAAQAETIEAQALALTAAAPAIEFVAKYADSTGLKGFRQVCKLLGAKENDFREFLLEKRIMYRLGGEWVPHAAHMDTGRFVVKTGTSDVSGHAFNSAKFTPKGVQWVAGEYAKHNLEVV